MRRIPTEPARDDTAGMSLNRTNLTREDRVLRAVLFVLAVVAQLFLPAMVMRAQAFAGELCVTQVSSGDAQKAKPHAHDECLQCGVHNASPPMAPSDHGGALRAHEIGRANVSALEMRLSIWRRAQPPPTGPPVLA